MSSIFTHDLEGRDPIYLDALNETLPWHKSAKNYWQSLYDQNKDLLDLDFPNKLSYDFFSGLWELTLIDYLWRHENNHFELLALPGKVSKPDFCFKYNGQKFFVEAVCSSPGNRVNLSVPLAEISGKARLTPIGEYKESLCASLKEKAYTKYYGENSSGYKEYMTKTSGFIIAISVAKIPFFNQPRRLDVDMSCLFGLSSPKIPILPLSFPGNSEKLGRLYYDNSQPKFPKSSNISPIDSDYFTSEKYKHVSAVLISKHGNVFFPDIEKFENNRIWDDIRNDFTLIHNPFASIKLPRGLLSVRLEV
ncbi:MAG: hypothetical protein QM752_00285 [Gammaproteobacteria bacterium]